MAATPYIAAAAASAAAYSPARQCRAAAVVAFAAAGNKAEAARIGHKDTERPVQALRIHSADSYIRLNSKDPDRTRLNS